MNAPADGSTLRHVVISGRGPEAAAAAAALAVSLQGGNVKITLVSPADGQSSVGVERIRGGEQAFHRRLGIDEADLLRETGGVYALGTRFTDFAGNGESVFVPLGSHGMTLRLLPFHQYWCHLRSSGDTEPYNDYSLPAVAASRGRFVAETSKDDPVSATWAYDLLVDPDLIAHYYLGLARRLGVATVSDPVVGGTVDSQGFVKSIRLHGGGELDGDLFIDCSAERSIIASLADAADFDDWSPHLPCDRMISALTPKHGESRLYSATKALDNGWLQHVTLQQFDVTSLAYCSRDIDDANAKLLLDENMKSAPISRSRVRRWRSGSYRPQWVRNCVAIGPAAMAVEPLIASSLQIACNAILRLLGMLPASRDNPMLASEFNRVASEDHAGIRDFTHLHYQLAHRPVSPFWSHSRDASPPQTLRRRMQHYASNGRLSVGENEGFADAQWLATLINFGMLPVAGDPLVEMADPGRVRSTLLAFREAVRQAAETGIPR